MYVLPCFGSNCETKPQNGDTDSDVCVLVIKVLVKTNATLMFFIKLAYSLVPPKVA